MVSSLDELFKDTASARSGADEADIEDYGYKDGKDQRADDGEFGSGDQCEDGRFASLDPDSEDQECGAGEGC